MRPGSLCSAHEPTRSLPEAALLAFLPLCGLATTPSAKALTLRGGGSKGSRWVPWAGAPLTLVITRSFLM